MAIRAVILAVENYGSIKGGGLVSTLEGTLEDASRFRDWLQNNKGVDPQNITFCLDPTAAQIATAFRDLADEGQNSTEELYVFFSGHGFSYNDNPLRQKPADILVGSEFENLNDSGNACLKLPEIQFALYQRMGPGTHFYFVDACRNPVGAKDVNPGGLGWSRPSSQLGQPAVFTLFSAERGNVAAVRSGFATAVVDGLTGRGRAKRREGVEMWVSFDSLRNYLETVFAQRIAPEPGPGPGHILRIDPIPIYRCTVRIRNADKADQFTATLLNAFAVQVGQGVAFQGSYTEFQAKPDDYFVQVTHAQYALNPAGPAKADLYDDCAVEFEKTTVPAAPTTLLAPAAFAPISITGPASATLEITNLETGEVDSSQQATFTGLLRPGPYQVRVLESGWTAVRNLRFSVDPPGPTGGEYIAADLGGLRIDAASRDPSPLRDSLLDLIPGEHDLAHADFSEQLGPMANQDLGLWLSIIGASRILGAQEFSKLSNLPLISFDDVHDGAAPIYILAGKAGAYGFAEAVVRQPGGPMSLIDPMQPVLGAPGLYEMRVDTPPGMYLVYLRSAEKSTCATLAYTLPNRATLFIAATDSSGDTNLYQFMLPLAKLRHNLTLKEQEALSDNGLEAIRFTTLAQRQMARLRSPKPPAVGNLRFDPKLEKDKQSWDQLLHGKWLDPVMALMAAYQLAGNQKSEETLHWLNEALGNLRTYFSALPDVEVIAKIAGLPYNAPQSLPLFLLGLQAVEAPGLLMPLPMAKLDYAGPWVTWLGVQ